VCQFRNRNLKGEKLHGYQVDDQIGGEGENVAPRFRAAGHGCRHQRRHGADHVCEGGPRRTQEGRQVPHGPRGSGSTTDTLDPATFPDTFNGVFGWGSTRSSLTEVTPKGEIISDVAESFEASPDAKTWVFTLRKGVEFHSGKSFDSEDAVVSLNHHRSEESKSAAKSLLATVTDIKADGKDKVIVTLSDGNADFPFVVSDYHLAMMPAKDGKADWQSGIGTGPYAMTGFDPGVRATGKRFANYHRETYFDEIEIQSISTWWRAATR
jgi:peptide/nickel transport system substrate-binding protein